MVSDMNEDQQEITHKVESLQLENHQMQFSEEEIQNLREIFDLFDKNSSGSI